VGTTLTVDVFQSVDGWAKGKTSPGYFGYLGAELDDWITAELARPQLVVLGRRTHDILAGLPEEARDTPEHRMTSSARSCSQQQRRRPRGRTRICRDDLMTDVHRLNREGEVPLRTMGSLSVARQLLSAGLVDRLSLMTFPLLVGTSGREPVFADATSADLELVNHHAWMVGCC
jgi:dihydrofolate reductase